MPIRPSEVSDYLTFAQAAELLGVHRSAIYDAVAAGKLSPVVVLGKQALVRSEVLAYTPKADSRRRRQMRDLASELGDGSDTAPFSPSLHSQRDVVPGAQTV